MTLPLFLAAHLIYGVAMAFVLFRRMHSEGEVLGVPLLWTLLPVGTISFPVGAILLRYAGGWFLHGFFIGEGSVPYERFHLGLMFGIGVLAGVCATAALFFAVAFISRDRPRIAMVPGLIGLVAIVVTVALDAGNVFTVAGTGGRHLWAHPVGLVTLGEIAALIAAWLYARARIGTVVAATYGASGPNRVARA